jgi:hypothetical protein
MRSTWARLISSGAPGAALRIQLAPVDIEADQLGERHAGTDESGREVPERLVALVPQHGAPLGVEHQQALVHMTDGQLQHPEPGFERAHLGAGVALRRRSAPRDSWVPTHGARPYHAGTATIVNVVGDG